MKQKYRVVPVMKASDPAEIVIAHELAISGMVIAS